MTSKEFEIPKDVTLELSGSNITVKGAKGEIQKRLETLKEIKIEKIENKVKVSSKSSKRKTKAMIGTIIAHIRNACDGVLKGYTYRMRIIYSHFPVTVKVEGDRFIVTNFLGERVPRTARIIGDTQIKIEKQDVTLTGIDIDKVSQTAGNIEQTCRIVGVDKKVFQDGIYITSKGD